MSQTSPMAPSFLKATLDPVRTLLATELLHCDSATGNKDNQGNTRRSHEAKTRNIKARGARWQEHRHVLSFKPV